MLRLNCDFTYKVRKGQEKKDFVLFCKTIPIKLGNLSLSLMKTYIQKSGKGWLDQITKRYLVKTSQTNNRKRMGEFLYKFFCWLFALVFVRQGLTVYLRLGFTAQSAC